MTSLASKPKRVALVTNYFLAGGLKTMTAFLYETLRADGRYEAEIISLATSARDEASLRLAAPQSWRRGPVVMRRQAHGIDYYHVGAWGVELEFQRYRPRPPLDRLLEQFDLIQFVVGTPSWACVAANVRRPQLLWTATTTWADRASRLREAPPLRRLWQRLMTRQATLYERRALAQVDQVLALSHYTAEAVRPFLPQPAPIAVCGVDTDLFRPASGPPHGERQNYILCVGRLSDPRKNLRLLLRAYATAVAQNETMPDLYLVGDAPAQSEQWLQALGLTTRVRLLGPRQGTELAELYRQAQFFVLSSDEEGLAIVIAEAMASGLPVISTDCGGPATVVIPGETGCLTPVGDAQALAEAMLALSGDADLRQRMGVAGRQMAEKQFSLTAAGQVFLQYYDQTLSG